MTSSAEVRCNCRKHAITGLRCSRCDAPICPDCSKPAPIGFLCRSCASGSVSPLHKLNAGAYGLAIGVGLPAAAFVGWLLSANVLHFGGFFGLIISFAMGTGLGEVLLRLTGRKRGTTMEVLTGVVVVGGMLLGQLINYSFPSSPYVGHTIHVAFFDPTVLLMILAATVGAVNRIRYIS